MSEPELHDDGVLDIVALLKTTDAIDIELPNLFH